MYSMIFLCRSFNGSFIGSQCESENFVNLTIEKWRDIQIFNPKNKTIPYSILNPMASKPGRLC